MTTPNQCLNNPVPTMDAERPLPRIISEVDVLATDLHNILSRVVNMVDPVLLPSLPEQPEPPDKDQPPDVSQIESRLILIKKSLDHLGRRMEAVINRGRT